MPPASAARKARVVWAMLALLRDGRSLTRRQLAERLEYECGLGWTNDNTRDRALREAAGDHRSHDLNGRELLRAAIDQVSDQDRARCGCDQTPSCFA